jgi:hypothetical protein
MAKRPKKSADARVRRQRKSTNVPGTYLGFSVQATRFLAHLLKAEPGDAVCLEVFEDVGVEQAAGTTIAEQVKSTRTGNPLSDRSIQLWKTFRNWIEASGSGTLEPDKTQFVIYLTRGVTGNIAASFNAALTIEDAKAAIRDAMTSLKIPGVTAKVDQTSPLEDHFRAVFLSGSDILETIVHRFRIELSKSSPHDDLRPLFLKKLISEDAYEDVVRWAGGWVKQKIDKLISCGQPARIMRDEFHGALLNYVRTYDRNDILRSVASHPAPEDIAVELTLRDYIRQLRLIDVDDVDLLRAANDYLRSASDRTLWAERGLIGVESLEMFADELATTWHNKKDRVLIGNADLAPKLQGRLVFRDCIEHRAQVDGLDAPQHFVRGSWHTLSDSRIVGWHPNYTTELDSTATPSEVLDVEG